MHLVFCVLFSWCMPTAVLAGSLIVHLVSIHLARFRFTNLMIKCTSSIFCNSSLSSYLSELFLVFMNTVKPGL